MSPRRWLLVSLVGAAYLAVYAATSGVAHRPVHVLYDSTGDIPVAYRWVRPPTDLSVDNVAPAPARGSVTPGQAATVSTPDAQAVLTLPASSVPPGSSGDALVVDIEPLAADTIAGISGGRQPDGNAYLVRFAYRTGGALGRTIAPFDIALREPQFDLVQDALLWSADRSGPWIPIPAVQSGPDSLTGPWDQPGYFVLAGRVRFAKVGVARVVEVVVAVVVVVGGIVWAARRSRSSRRGGIDGAGNQSTSVSD